MIVDRIVGATASSPLISFRLPSEVEGMEM